MVGKDKEHFTKCYDNLCNVNELCYRWIKKDTEDYAQRVRTMRAGWECYDTFCVNALPVTGQKKYYDEDLDENI